MEIPVVPDMFIVYFRWPQELRETMERSVVPDVSAVYFRWPQEWKDQMSQMCLLCISDGHKSMEREWKHDKFSELEHEGEKKSHREDDQHPHSTTER